MTPLINPINAKPKFSPVRSVIQNSLNEFACVSVSKLYSILM